MITRLRLLLLLPLSLGLAVPLPGQSQPPASTNTTLGQSIVPLNGPWKFHVGDDPKWADQYDPDALPVLQALNYRLCGRGQAHRRASR